MLTWSGGDGSLWDKSMPLSQEGLEHEVRTALDEAKQVRVLKFSEWERRRQKLKEIQAKRAATK